MLLLLLFCEEDEAELRGEGPDCPLMPTALR